jgi:hypothetical protein
VLAGLPFGEKEFHSGRADVSGGNLAVLELGGSFGGPGSDPLDHCAARLFARDPPTIEGLSKLRETRSDLLFARLSALQAQVNLSDARAERARELTELIADALAHYERLLFYVQDGC